MSDINSSTDSIDIDHDSTQGGTDGNPHADSASDNHDNTAHSSTYAVDGDSQPPETHDNTAHSDRSVVASGSSLSLSDVEDPTINHYLYVKYREYDDALDVGIANSDSGDDGVVYTRTGVTDPSQWTYELRLGNNYPDGGMYQIIEWVVS